MSQGPECMVTGEDLSDERLRVKVISEVKIPGHLIGRVYLKLH
jgi:hypothetical protein